ncbi:macrolide family glycosyltransferase [uncultured Clostridium sp.]|uniref:macrolide family glycosyltransferase n=1 Tax=uncultured Clostridium sp. TaxID=59620 RepID=UPI00261DAAA6|nr:macrolide family glycosyltransferase [uncultured Clostridium sp.]
MGNGLFITMMGHGHVNPTLGLVKELMARGEKITYIAGFEFEDKIKKIGAEFVGYENKMNLSNFLSGGKKLSNLQASNIKKEHVEKIGEMMGAQFTEMVEKVFGLKEKFDYLVYDSSFIIGEEVAKTLKVPAISSTTIFLLNKAILEERPEASFMKLGRYVRSGINYDSENFTNISRKYGVSFESLKDKNRKMANGDLKIVYTSRYLQPRSEDFDESHLFIGASVGDRNEGLDFSIDKNKKTIYISLGTLFNKSVEFYKECIEAFKDMDLNIILSVGKSINIQETFKDIPKNFIIKNYVSQLDVLKETDIFITHGGMNSTNEGLYFDIPLIFIPQSVDQPFVANRVKELGAGLVINKDEISKEKLKESVNIILENKEFRENSKKIGKSLRDAGGYKKGVDEILKLRDSYK